MPMAETNIAGRRSGGADKGSDCSCLFIEQIDVKTNSLYYAMVKTTMSQKYELSQSL